MALSLAINSSAQRWSNLAAVSQPLRRSLSVQISEKPLPDGVPEQQEKATGVKVKGTTYMIPQTGDPPSKTPFKVHLEAGKTYSWCSCGFSRKQPFCDGSHNELGLTILRPVKFEAKRTGDHFLCGCKMTTHRPLCDGKHKTLSPGHLLIDVPLFHMVAYEAHDPHSNVTNGVAKRLGLREREGHFELHNRKPAVQRSHDNMYKKRKAW